MQDTIDSLKALEDGTATDKIIEIKSIYKNGKTTVMPLKNPQTGWFFGVPRLSEDDKKKHTVWASPSDKFVLRAGTTFDLNKEEDLVRWKWVLHQPCLAASYEECQSRNGAEFYVFMRGKEAEQRLSKKLIKFKAAEYIIKDNPVNYPLRSKLLGVNMDYEKSLSTIKDFLMERAESSAEDVIKIYEDTKVSLRMLLMTAVEKNKVSIDPSGAYRYGNIFLGMSEDSAVDWLNEIGNKQTVVMLEQETNPEYFQKNDEGKTELVPEKEPAKPAAKKSPTRK